ncbi:MAG TPA: zinc-binding dehydrogenase, partial [Acidimicrobiales bacterium]|nr:zinc-binding dehydrogenase [Acidimicrobiales bacterium]
ADAVVDYRATDFVAEVDAVTGGRGVDLVFDGVGLPDQSLRCLAYGGRYRIIGFSGGIEAEEQPFVTPRTLCFGNFSVGGVLLAYTSHPEAARRATGFNITPRATGEEVHARLTGLVAAGRVRPVVGATVGCEDLPAALEAMEERRTIGRTVVRW